MYLKSTTLSFEQVSEFIAYDPATGLFTWKKAPSRRHKVGQPAGRMKAVKNIPGCAPIKYMYVGLLNHQIPAARVAWLLMKGEWPKTNIVYKDDDTSNLKFDNLKEAEFASVKTITGAVRTYKMTKEAQRHYALRSQYGISIAEYNQMLADQGGVCAVCKRPETGKTPYGGAAKPLSVDHNHETNQVRGLLCTQCNYMIGHCRESEEILLAGAAYLRKYRSATVVPLRSVEDQK
jgi:hypothetical protein